MKKQEKAKKPGPNSKMQKQDNNEESKNEPESVLSSESVSSSESETYSDSDTSDAATSSESGTPSDETSTSGDSEYFYSDSNPQDIRVTAMHVEWNIYKDKPTILGNVVLDIKQLNPNVDQLRLDMDTGLKIMKILDSKNKEPLAYKEKRRSYMDKMLVIYLPKSAIESNKCSVIVKYKKTTTDGLYYHNIDHKDYRLMFSHFEYLRGKKLFPCQDTPTNNVLFSATIHIDKNLQILMSAKLVNTKNRPDSKIKTLYFINPHPVPVYAIGFIMGKFQMTEISDNVKIYSEKTMPNNEILKQIPAYIEMINDLVGQDPWREHHIVLVKPLYTYTYPYLNILNLEELSPESVLQSLSYNWFRSAITIQDINDLWLHEAFPLYVARRLASYWGNEIRIEKKIHKAATAYKNVLIKFKAQIFSDEENVELLAERAYVCLLLLEHYGGKYGEFDCLLRRYYKDSKFKYADLQTLIKLSEQCLHFGDEDNFCMSKDHEELSKIQDWIVNDAPIPKDFQNRATPFVEIQKSLNWLLRQSRDSIPEDDTERKKVGVKAGHLALFTPKFVNHRMRKLLLLDRLSSFEKGKLDTQVFQILVEQMNMNCSKDEKITYEFLKLSIDHQQLNQLKTIKEFVVSSSEMKQLIDIMGRMLKWERESNKVNTPDEYNYTPMRRDIIKLCDSKLEQLIQENEKKNLAKKK